MDGQLPSRGHTFLNKSEYSVDYQHQKTNILLVKEHQLPSTQFTKETEISHQISPDNVSGALQPQEINARPARINKDEISCPDEREMPS